MPDPADFIDDLDEVLLAIEALPAEAEAIVANSIALLAYDVDIFTLEIAKEIKNMTTLGVSKEIIENTLKTDLVTGGRIFGRLRNDLKEVITQSINNSSRMGQYSEYDLDKGQFTWVVVGGHRICHDCMSREDIIMNYKNWESAGLPGSGWSVCKGHCYCILDPTGEIKSNLNTEVKEKIPR